MSKQRGLEEALKDYRKAVSDTVRLTNNIPRILGVEMVEWIHDNFRKESYLGAKWEPRKPETNAAYDRRTGVKGSVFNSANPILRQTGNLFDAIRYHVEGRFVFVGFDTNKIPYGQVHNEGGQFTTRTQSIMSAGGRFAFKEGVHMPKRQFMPIPGEEIPETAWRRLTRKFIFERDRIWRKFAK